MVASNMYSGRVLNNSHRGHVAEVAAGTASTADTATPVTNVTAARARVRVMPDRAIKGERDDRRPTPGLLSVLRPTHGR